MKATTRIRKVFWQEAKAGFTGFFKNAGNAIANPVQTVKTMFSPKALLDNTLNVATMGAFDMAKGTVDNTRVVMKEGIYGLGKIAGEKAAEVAIFVATEGTGKSISGG